GDSGEAQRLAQEALKKNPDYRPAMVTMARDHYRRRRLDLALYTLKGILDGYGQENPPRDKKSAEAHLLRGLIYKEQGRRASAVDDFRAALGLRPDLVEARLQLGGYLLESGNAGEAAQLLEGVLRYDELNVLARLNLGDAYRLLGKTSAAKQQLDWVLQKDPTLAQAHYDLALLYLFSENVPGLNPKQAVELAIFELKSYKQMKPRSQAADDADELLTRAETKKALLAAQQTEKAAAASAASAPAPARSAPPSAGQGNKPVGASGGSTGSVGAFGSSGSGGNKSAGTGGSGGAAGSSSKGAFPTAGSGGRK
ncbi:MAG TPA: tetratricopeptide repeat protein, partial [Polyangiaceae bacterium]